MYQIRFCSFLRFSLHASLLLASFFLTQCQTTSRGSHRGEYLIHVQKGDTLASIAHRFDTSPLAIVRLNHLNQPIRLKVGDTLRVIPGPSGLMAGAEPIAPGGIPARSSGKNRGVEPSGSAADPGEFTEADFPTLPPSDRASAAPPSQGSGASRLLETKRGLFFGGSIDSAPLESPKILDSDPLIERDFLEESSPIRDELLALEPLRWPLRGSISSHFGNRRGHFHKGVDITAPHGSPILPAAEGKVVFAGRKKRYGKMVLLQHRFHQTLYAHLSSVKVRRGEWVDLKKVIGNVGATGNARGIHLHFEVIDASEKPVDPVAIMNKSHSFRIAKISGEKDLRNRGTTRIQ